MRTVLTLVLLLAGCHTLPTRSDPSARHARDCARLEAAVRSEVAALDRACARDAECEMKSVPRPCDLGGDVAIAGRANRHKIDNAIDYYGESCPETLKKACPDTCVYVYKPVCKAGRCERQLLEKRRC